MIIGTCYFVSFTKACDYYRGQSDELTPAQLERIVKRKINEGEISIGKPDVPEGARLLIIDSGTRYALED
jgi:hypothetical protein